MKLVDMKLSEFLNELASKSPAPGGGSVAALSGSTGASLVLMVGELTTKKKKFRELDEVIKEKYLMTLEHFKAAKVSFEQYIDEDTEAFNKVMEAYGLPKETEEDQKIRNQAIEFATIGCIKTPMNVANLAMSCLNEMEFIIKYANRNTTSDQGVAVLSFYQAFLGAIMNVRINLPGLTQKDLVKEYNNVIMESTRKVETIKEKLIEEIDYLLK